MEPPSSDWQAQEIATLKARERMYGTVGGVLTLVGIILGVCLPALVVIAYRVAFF